MAQIKEFSSADLNTISRFGGVSNTLEKINGVTVVAAASFTGLLDTYTGAAAAYSVRRLLTAYTGSCMRVRRDSDDTEQDIGFDSNGDLDTAAIATFVGSGNNGYVTKWYGQESSGGTGSGLDIEQATQGNQPQIYNGTAVLTLNGKPRLLFAASDQMHKQSGVSLSVGACATFAVGKKVDTASTYGAWMMRIGDGSTRQNDFVNMIFDQNDRSSYQLHREESNTEYSVTSDSNDVFSQYLSSALVTSSQLENWLNGTSLNTTSHTPSTVSLTTINVGAAFTPVGGTDYKGDMQELVFFNADQSSNRTGIETNINNYFSIY
jgi:hypothetical protein